MHMGLSFPKNSELHNSHGRTVQRTFDSNAQHA
jgi:hypothetical protein